MSLLFLYEKMNHPNISIIVMYLYLGKRIQDFMVIPFCIIQLRIYFACLKTEFLCEKLRNIKPEIYFQTLLSYFLDFKVYILQVFRYSLSWLEQTTPQINKLTTFIMDSPISRFTYNTVFSIMFNMCVCVCARKQITCIGYIYNIGNIFTNVL